MTVELMLGVCRTFKAIRAREGLTQKKLAAALGISEGYLKRLERGKLELIGPNGVSIGLLAKIAEFLKTHPATIFAEVVSHTNITQRDDRSAKLDKALTSISSASLDELLKPKSKKSPFGNNILWNLEMAAALSRLPDKERARIGLEILRGLVSNGLVKQSDVNAQMQELFAFSSL